MTNSHVGRGGRGKNAMIAGFTAPDTEGIISQHNPSSEFNCWFEEHT